MSGVSFWEVMLVFLIGLIVLGPERLPRVAHQLGTWLGQARRMTRMMKRQLEEELNLENNPSIRRPARLPRASQAPEHQTPDPVDKDDKYSPAHEEDAPGTGVGSDDRRDHRLDDHRADTAPETPEAASGERDTPAEAAEPPAQERVS